MCDSQQLLVGLLAQSGVMVTVAGDRKAELARLTARDAYPAIRTVLNTAQSVAAGCGGTAVSAPELETITCMAASMEMGVAIYHVLLPSGVTIKCAFPPDTPTCDVVRYSVTGSNSSNEKTLMFPACVP